MFKRQFFTSIFLIGFPITLGLSFFCARIAAGWNATPEVYIFFLFCIFLFISTLLIYKPFKKHKVNITKIDLCILILAFYCLIRQAPGGFAAIQNDLLLTYGILLLLYFSFRIALNKNFDHNIHFIVHCIVIFGVLQISICATQIFKYDILKHPMSLTGSFANANTLAAYLSLCLPFVYYSIFAARKSRQPVLLTVAYGVCAICILAIIFFTRSRGAFVAAMISPVLLALPRLKLIWKKACRTKKYVFATTVMACALYLCYLLFLKKDSALGRILIWHISGDMFIKKPFFGYGFGVFERTYMLFQEQYFINHPNSKYLLIADDVYFPYNIFLEIAITVGLIGLLLFCYIAWSAIIIKKDNDGLINIMCSVTIITCIINGCFSYTLQSIPVLIILIMAISVQSCLSPPFYKLPSGIIWLPIIICFPLCIYLFFQFTAHKYWKQGVATVLMDSETAFGQYEKAYRYIGHRNMFLYNYGTTLYEMGETKKSYTILKQAEKLMNDTYLNMYLGKVTERMGKNAEAERYYQRAINMNPKLFYPRLYFLQLLIREKKRDKAKLEAQKIIALPEKISSAESKKIKEFALNYLQPVF